jgi:hypothetical protein
MIHVILAIALLAQTTHTNNPSTLAIGHVIDLTGVWYDLKHDSKSPLGPLSLLKMTAP